MRFLLYSWLGGSLMCLRKESLLLVFVSVVCDMMGNSGREVRNWCLFGFMESL